MRAVRTAPAITTTETATFTPVSPAASASVQTSTPALSYRVATSLAAVLDAWRLVHDCHCDRGLIEENPFRVYTTPQAASPGATVLSATRGNEIVSTLTITRDGAEGLALDAVFGRELDRIRESGRRLSEVGLMASRGTANALDRLIAISLDYVLRDDYSAVVMAVHPRHAGYYTRFFGFEPCSRERPRLALGREPAVLIRADRDAFLESATPARGIRTLGAQCLPGDFYAGAFGFLPSQLSGSLLAGYLAELAASRSSAADRRTAR